VLRSFRVANHRSIRAEQELLLMPAYDKIRPVVPVAALFGANASGKSNLLDALKFMQTAVRDSYADWKPGTGVPRRPFKLDPDAAAEPSVYVVDLLLDGVRHIYGFEVDDEKVREEWLYAFPHNRRRVIFDRTDQQIKLGSTLADHRARTTLLTELTRGNTLFLSAAAHANVAEVLPLYEWFRTRMAVLDPSPRADRHTLVEGLMPGSPARRAVLGLLRAADLGITDVIVDPAHTELLALQKDQSVLDLSPEDLLDKVRALLDRQPAGSPLRFIHGAASATLNLEEQSEGTRAWMAIIDCLLDVLADGRVMVVNEVDSSLHPRLTRHLVEMFKDPETNTRNAQLIIACQDATLLGRDLDEDILPRDSVWFVEKDRRGATSLYPLSGFKPRKDENTERRYLAGLYGAVPELYDVEFSQAVRAYRKGAVERAAS